MLNQFSRTEILLGNEAMNKIANKQVAVFGIGGVGSYAVESLVRAGISNITIIDNDNICITNINRQIHANMNNIGCLKTEAMKKRILEINPKATVITINEFVLRENISQILNQNLDFIIDAVDTVTAKLAIIEKAYELNIPIISSMGTGNKIYPHMLKLGDIYETSVCPLAKVMRKELKRRNIPSLKVCYSEEQAITPIQMDIKETGSKNTKRQTPGSISFVPPVSGLIMAGYVIRKLVGFNE